MLPNDHLVGLAQANATMSERHRQAAQERLVATSRSSAGLEALTVRRDPSRGFSGLADRVRTALGGHGRARQSAADDKPGTAAVS